MRIRRTFPVIIAVLIVAAAVTLAVQLRKLAPPEAARLLPGADAFFYLDLNKVRKANAGKELPPVSHDPEYERFINATGFEFERDLDQAAFAIHYPPGRDDGSGNPRREPRFSEVLIGKFYSQRLSGYLRQIARSVENYHNVDIFTIPLEGRLLRVAVLSADSVAASNHEDPAVIQGVVDRSMRLASPFGGPALLRQYYKNVQLASLAWAIARVDPTKTDSPLNSVIAKPATVVVSGSVLSPLHPRAGAIHLRAEAFTQSADEARDIADKATIFIALSHSAELSAGTHGTDSDVKAVFDSLKVKQEGNRAVMTAALPLGFVHKMLSEPQPEANAPPGVPSNGPSGTPEQPAKKR